MERTSPVGRRRHLSRELLRLRESTSQTAAQVAKRLGWTPSSITHIERNDWKLPKIHLVEDLLDVYGVTAVDEPQRRTELLDYARQGRGRGWWEQHKHLTDDAATYIGLEQEAITERMVAPLRLPGVLQHPDHARALYPDPDQAEAAAAIVMRRQELLEHPDPLVVWAIVGEGVLRQQVGGPDVHARQLDHLVELAGLPTVRLLIFPFTAPVPPSTEFVHLAFRDVIDPEAVYIPSAGGGTWREDPAEVAPFTNQFEALLAAALTRAQSRRVLAEIALGAG